MGIGRVTATGAIVVAGLGMLGACGWDITKERDTDRVELTEEFSGVRFVNDSGNLAITTGDELSVSRVIHFEDERPGDTHRVENGTLILDSCPTRGCWIDYEVVVPEGTTVDGELHSGNVEISGVGAVNLLSDSGTIEIHDVQGAVNVDSDSGNVDLHGIHGAAQVRASSGNVSVALAVQEDVRVEVSSGNVDVSVPKGAYQVNTDVDSGDLDVNSEIADDDSADHHIDVKADSGNITVTTT